MYEKIYPPNTIFEDGVGRHYEDEYDGSGDEERGQDESRGAEYSQWEDEEDEDCDTNFFITASIQNVVSDKITHDDEDAEEEETVNTSVNSKNETAASLVEAASAASLFSAEYEEEDFEDYSQSRGNTAANPPARRTEEEPLIAATAATIDCVGDSLTSVGKLADMLNEASDISHVKSPTDRSNAPDSLVADKEQGSPPFIEANSQVVQSSVLSAADSAASLFSAEYEGEDFEDYSQSRGNTAANPPARRTEEEPLIAATAATIDCVGDSLISVGKGSHNFKHITSETQDEDNSQSSGTYEGNKVLKALEKLNMSPVVNTREEPIILSSAVSAASLQSAVYEDEDFEEYSQSFDEMSASTVVTTAVILGAAPTPPSGPKPSASSPRKAEAVSRNAEAVKSGARYSKKQGVG
jgi:hypothetical protein